MSTTATPTPSDIPPRFSPFAWGVLVYTLAVIVFGAWVRITGSGADVESPRGDFGTKGIGVASGAQLDVHAGLEVTLFASEPEMFSPTNIDIDDRGRIFWARIHVAIKTDRPF